MVAAKHVMAVDWSDILDRLMVELDAAKRSRMYGDLTLTVRFEDGVAVTEKIGTVKSRKLNNQ